MTGQVLSYSCFSLPIAMNANTVSLFIEETGGMPPLWNILASATHASPGARGAMGKMLKASGNPK